MVLDWLGKVQQGLHEQEPVSNPTAVCGATMRHEGVKGFPHGGLVSGGRTNHRALRAAWGRQQRAPFWQESPACSCRPGVAETPAAEEGTRIPKVLQVLTRRLAPACLQELDTVCFLPGSCHMQIGVDIQVECSVGSVSAGRVPAIDGCSRCKWDNHMPPHRHQWAPRIRDMTVRGQCASSNSPFTDIQRFTVVTWSPNA